MEKNEQAFLISGAACSIETVTALFVSKFAFACNAMGDSKCYWLVLERINAVLSISFQKFGILSLEQSSQHRGGRPSAWIDCQRENDRQHLLTNHKDTHFWNNK